MFVDYSRTHHVIIFLLRHHVPASGSLPHGTAEVGQERENFEFFSNNTFFPYAYRTGGCEGDLSFSSTYVEENIISGNLTT